jgi:RimJ/RimL family protein N-acetyltransferase
MLAIIETSIDQLCLRELDASDADALFVLVRENTPHLTQNGDYAELVSCSLQEMRQALAIQTDAPLRFGLLFKGSLVGRLDLIAVDPPRYSIGYWLAQDATAKGYATAAITTACVHARDALGASDIYAGVTHGNHKSVAVLERAGFRKVENFERYARFHLPLRAG